MRISGPVNVTILSHKESDNDNTITIFGDYHFNTDHQCSPCKISHNCMSINKYLIKIYNEKNNDNVDFFIESPFILKNSKIKSAKEKTKYYGAVMGSLIHEFGECLVSSKTCDYNKRNKRLHYIDIRYNEYYVYIFEKLRVIYETMKSDIKSAKKQGNNSNAVIRIGLLGIMNNFYTNNDDKNIEPRVFFDATIAVTRSKKIFMDFVRLFYKSDSMHHDMSQLMGARVAKKLFPHEKQITKIRKQLIKLPVNVQENIIEFIENKMEKFVTTIDFNKIKKIDKIFDPKNHVYSNLDELYDSVSEIEYLLTDIGVYLVDLYTIARMYYYNHVIGSRVISFVGDMHSDNYRQFFKKYAKMNVDYPITPSLFSARAEMSI
jgi:hypothetical protein